MEKFINVKYKLKSSNNFENYLKFIEVGLILRKTALAVSPVCTLTREGDVYTLTMSTSFKTVKVSFKLNEESLEERADGAKVKTTFTIDGNKLIQVQTDPNGKISKHVREFSADKLIVTTTAEGWDGTSVRVYERID